MTDPAGTDPTARRYSDSEVRILLERASRVRSHLPAATRPQGLTLTQLESIAAEADIDVAQLREAARELDIERAAVPKSTAARLAGAPLRVHVEHTLPFEVADEALQELVTAMGLITDESGEPRFVGRTFTWTTSTPAGRRMQVHVSARGGATHIRIEERYTEIAGGLFGGVLAGVGGGVGLGGGGALAGILGSAAIAVAVPAVVIAGSYAACRAGFRAYVRRRARRLDAICRRIVEDLTAGHEADQA